MIALEVFVMAAGESRRFGSPKQLALINQVPLVLHTYHAIIHPLVSRKSIVLGAHYKAVKKVLPDAVVHHYCPNWQQGLSASLQTAISNVQDDTTHVLIALADQIMLKQQHYAELVEAMVNDPKRVVAAHYSARNAVPAIFPRKHLHLFEQLSGDRGAGQILNSSTNVSQVSLPSAAQDIDTEDDLKDCMDAL